jgi:hypothetical protein
MTSLRTTGTAAVPALAQTGSIAGAVRDSSAAVVPNVSGAAAEASRSFKPETAAKEAGLYSLPVSPVRAYTVQAEAGGFAKREFMLVSFLRHTPEWGQTQPGGASASRL